MTDYLEFYIDGRWVAPAVPKTLDVIDPSTEEPIARISAGSAADVNRAVDAARRAFETFGYSPREERIALLERVVGGLPAPGSTRSPRRSRAKWARRCALAKAAQAPLGTRASQADARRPQELSVRRNQGHDPESAASRSASAA